MNISKDEMRRLIREEIEPVETMVRRVDTAIRGNGTAGLNQRVGSLEQSRSLHKKLWGAILGIVVTIAGAMATKLLG